MSDLKIFFLPVGAGDCILLQFDNARFNMLVDAGSARPHTRVESLCKVVAGLVPSGVIDLAIVTHNDDDHIGGFFHMLSGHSGLVVKELMFNSTLLVDKLLGQSGLTDISARQAVALSAMKSTRNARVVCAGQTAKVFDEHVELVFLSPVQADVARYGVRSAVEMIPPKDIGTRRPFRALAQLQEDPDFFIEDKSKANLLSLAFEVKFKGKAWLFLGDAWPSRVESALDALYPDSPPHYELVKVSHHGSSGNTTAGLLARLSCREWVFLADGKVHPHEEVFRRILESSKHPRNLFYFPQQSQLLSGLLEEYQADVVYPEAGALLAFDYGVLSE